MLIMLMIRGGMRDGMIMTIEEFAGEGGMLRVYRECRSDGLTGAGHLVYCKHRRRDSWKV
jgi:hypothetical protein